MSDTKIIESFVNYNFPELKFKPCHSVYNDDWYGFAHFRGKCISGHPAILRFETDKVVVINQLAAWIFNELADPFGDFKQYGIIDTFNHLQLPLSNPNILDILKPLVQMCITQWKDHHAEHCKSQRRRSNPKDAN